MVGNALTEQLQAARDNSHGFANPDRRSVNDLHQDKTPLERRGWQKVGSHYEKAVPLPGNWDSMTEAERANWLHVQQVEAQEDLGEGPGGPVRGRTEDPMTGERGWFGYAGQSPSKDDLEWMSHGPKVSV